MSRAPARASCRRGDAQLRVHERGGGGLRVDPGLGEQHHRQGLEAFFPSRHGARPTLGAEGQIDVLQRGHGLGRQHHLLERLGQVAVGFQRLEDGGAAVLQLMEFVHPVADGSDCDLVQAARGLLAVAGDERDRGAFGQQGGDGRHLGFIQCKFGCDAARDGARHGPPWAARLSWSHREVLLYAPYRGMSSHRPGPNGRPSLPKNPFWNKIETVRVKPISPAAPGRNFFLNRAAPERRWIANTGISP